MDQPSLKLFILKNMRKSLSVTLLVGSSRVTEIRIYVKDDANIVITILRSFYSLTYM